MTELLPQAFHMLTIMPCLQENVMLVTEYCEGGEQLRIIILGNALRSSHIVHNAMRLLAVGTHRASKISMPMQDMAVY